MRRTLLLLVAGLAGCSSLSLGTPLRPPDARAPGPTIVRAWEEASGAAFGPAAPILTQDVLVIGTRQGEVRALDPETGRLRGSVSLGRSVEGQLAVAPDGRTVYVPLAEADGGLVAYDVVGGAVRWRWPGGGIQGGVVRLADEVVTTTRAGETVGLDPDTGEVRWTHRATPGAQVHAAPVALGRDVIVADDRGRVVRLAGATGEVVWSGEIGQPIYSTPLVDEDVYLTSTRGRVIRLAAATGATRWVQDRAGDPRASPPVRIDGSIVVGFTDGRVAALDRSTGEPVWETTLGAAITARPAAFSGRIAVGTMDNRLVLLDADTGQPGWSADLRGRVKSAVGIGSGLVVVLIEPQHVVAFRSAP